MNRRVLQLLPATTGDRLRVAWYAIGEVAVEPIRLWALVRYDLGDGERFERVEPVSCDPEMRSMRIGNTEDWGCCGYPSGHPTDVVVLPHQEVRGVNWSSDRNGTEYGSIEISNAYPTESVSVDRPPKVKEAK